MLSFSKAIYVNDRGQLQSNAGANRNVSEGAKPLLEDAGKAEVKESGGWFNSACMERDLLISLLERR